LAVSTIGAILKAGISPKAVLNPSNGAADALRLMGSPINHRVTSASCCEPYVFDHSERAVEWEPGDQAISKTMAPATTVTPLHIGLLTRLKSALNMKKDTRLTKAAKRN
jgi:hypothetical protein